MREHGLHHPMQEIWERGFKPVMADAVAEALEGATLYLSVDIDVMDPAFAPGTGTPAPGGVRVDLLRMVRQLALDTTSSRWTSWRWPRRTTSATSP